MEYSVLQRIDLIRKLTNASYPLISDRYSRQPLPIRIRDKLEIWRCAWNWRFGNARRDVRAKYRPSTGILALLVAIAEHGKDAEYILTGIGIQDRHIYQYGDRKVIMTKNKSKVLPKHTEADLMVLKHLRENWRISTTDDELALGRCQTKPA